MTKARPPATDNNDDYPETGGNPKPIAANDYYDPKIAKSFASRRSQGHAAKKSNKRTPEQAQARKIFFISQAKKAKAAGQSLSDFLSGSRPTPAPEPHTQYHNPTRYGSQRIKAAYGKHTLSSSESDPEEGPAPKQTHSGPHSNFSDPSTTHSDEEMAQAASDVEMEQATMSFEQNAFAAAQNTAAGPGASGGGGGVGESTGSWSCETIFGAKTIKTTASRHCICLVRNGHAYNGISSTGTTPANSGSLYLGVSTPWNYIDFNQMDIFFSPQEFQKLVNTAKKWRPRRFHVEIFNLQIIQKVLQTGSQTSFNYNNDLTSTVQVFADARRIYPILSYPNQSTVMSPFPNDIYTCPQYAYLTDNQWTASTGVTGNAFSGTNMLTNYSKFYVLDKHPSAMLRTGNNWSSDFDFGDDMGWFDNTRLTIPIHRMMNPLYDTYQTTLQGSNAAIGQFDQWRQPFKPGPYLTTGKANATAAQLAQQPTFPMQGTSYIGANPGPPNSASVQTHAGQNTDNNIINYLNSTQGYSSDSVSQEINNANLTTYTVPAISLRNANSSGPAKYPATSAAASTTAQPYSGIMPGMVWDKRPIHSRMCIWQRVPNTESGFEPGSELGGIPTRKAPGHIFIRLTPKPTDTANTFINEFATFTIKITMDWDVEWHEDYAWNPKNLFSWSTKDAQTGAYWPTFNPTSGQQKYNMNHIILGNQLARGN